MQIVAFYIILSKFVVIDNKAVKLAVYQIFSLNGCSVAAKQKVALRLIHRAKKHILCSADNMQISLVYSYASVFANDGFPYTPVIGIDPAGDTVNLSAVKGFEDVFPSLGPAKKQSHITAPFPFRLRWCRRNLLALRPDYTYLRRNLTLRVR